MNDFDSTLKPHTMGFTILKNSEHGVYGAPNGCEILNPENFPTLVHDYLKREREFLEHQMINYDTLIEGGCFDGTYLKWSHKRELNYIGVDVIPDYIEEARHRSAFFNVAQERHEFHVLDLTRLWELNERSAMLANQENKVMLLIPFNLFGNITPISELVSVLRNCEYDFLISNFSTSRIATETRNQYYNNCDFLNVTMKSNDDGVHFTSEDGLDSMAFSEEWMFQQFEGMNLKTIPLGDVGIGYLRVQ